MFTLYFNELNAPPFLKSYRPPCSLHSALISHDNYHISFAFWIAMTLPEYDQNPVVFVANLEEVKLEVLKLSIGMYRVLVLQPVLEKSGITISRQALSWKNYKILFFGKKI